MTPQAHQPDFRRVALTPSERGAMTAAVLARTTGSVCARALALVGSQPDESFDAQTAALVAGHLDHCDGCRAVEQTISETRAVLATMAEMEPAAGFTAQVVAATAGRRVAAWGALWAGLAERWAWPAAVRDRAASAWDRVLARPRLSLELAYLATVLLVIVIGNPRLIADALGARTTGLVAGDFASATVGIRQPGLAVQARGPALPAFVGRAMREIESRQASAAKGWNWLVLRTSQLVAASWNWLRGLFGWFDKQPPPLGSTEPAKAPVRASQ